jgi:hypothetical protein
MVSFILGAGFNVDAAAEARRAADSLHGGGHRPQCRYPLIAEILKLCFERDELPAGMSIEDLFATELSNPKSKPLEKLATCLEDADRQLAGLGLASRDAQNCYMNFFRTFPSANFLTFNYDCLAETCLHQLDLWYPHDGFGVPVKVTPGWRAETHTGRRSLAQVLHLHGTLYVRTTEFSVRADPSEGMGMLQLLEHPLYDFDPGRLTANFRDYDPIPKEFLIKDCIIAPVPDKSEGLKMPFIEATYGKAVDALRASDTVVAIGYSFSPHDRSSYARLLNAISGKLLVVSPDADTVAHELRRSFQSLTVQPMKATFNQWVASSFPGLPRA